MDHQPISILLLGDEDVGKSTFLSRLTALRNKNSPEARVAQAPSAVLRDSDQPFVLELQTRITAFRLEFSDTESPENWRLLRPDLVVLCYDISSRPSLASLQTTWINQVRSVFEHSDTLPVLVMGLKRDLRRDDADGTGVNDPAGTTVHPHEAYNLSQQLRADMYLECSAVTGELMPEVMDDICRRAIRTTTEEGGQSSGGCTLM